MIKILSVEQMRELERAADESGVSYGYMMEQAGRAVAEVIALLLSKQASDKRIVVLVGPGNNGGDGLVAARILKTEVGAQVSAYLLRIRGDDDPNFAAARTAGVNMNDAQSDPNWHVLEELVSTADVIIDALLGIGARLPIEGTLGELLKHASDVLDRANTTAKTLVWPALPVPHQNTRPIVVAVDCPTGLNADNGEIDPAAFAADFTVTFATAKKGHLAFPGAGAVGQLVVADISIPSALLDNFQLELASAIDVAARLPKRPTNGHKGTFGRVIVIAGSESYTGAASLSAESAYRAGAGLVTLAIPQPLHGVLASSLPEVTWLVLPDESGTLNGSAADAFVEGAGEFEAVLIGPGLGRDQNTAEFLWNLLSMIRSSQTSSGPSRSARLNLAGRLVIDADGLNLLSEREAWWSYLPINTVLTPHLGEMARLTGLSVKELAENRLAIASAKAQEWGVVLVLKGAFTLIVSPDGKAVISPFATDALATAGAGDILAGCITGLLAQGAKPVDAAIAGTYVHGLAGTMAGEDGTRSVIARDVLRMLPSAFNAIEANPRRWTEMRPWHSWAHFPMRAN